MPKLRNQAQSYSLFHSGLRLPPPLLLLLFFSPQLEDNWEQEKKIRAEVEKARRKAESDLKMTIDNLNEMERSKIDLEEVVKKYVHAVIHLFIFFITILAIFSTSWMAPGARYCAEGFTCINAVASTHYVPCTVPSKEGERKKKQVLPCPQRAPSLTQGMLADEKETGTKQDFHPRGQKVHRNL